MVRFYVSKKAAPPRMPPDQVIRKAFEYRDEHHGLWPHGWSTHLQRTTLYSSVTLNRYLKPPESDRFYGNVEEALLAANRFRWGGDKSINPALDMELKKALHDHVMELWRDATWSPSPNYVKAKWLRIQMSASITNPKPFNDEQWKRWKKTWRMSERIVSSTKARRIEAEKPETITRFFEGFDEDIGGKLFHHMGLKEILLLECDSRNGKSLSFADCLAMGQERMGNGDETCLMKAAVETKGVGPCEAQKYTRVNDGDRSSMTCMVFAGVFGTLYTRFYIKKGVVWTDDHLRQVKRRDCKFCLNPQSYMMDSGTLVMCLESLAKTIGVTPRYRYLMLLDGHSSRLEPAVRDAVAKLGFVLVIYPGSLTHIMQVRARAFSLPIDPRTNSASNVGGDLGTSLRVVDRDNQISPPPAP